ncbi:MAG: CapA family protein [Deltaproteobacteria bacterium]|nr:CapA family protein [Deltaproteobacteria bacterium]
MQRGWLLVICAACGNTTTSQPAQTSAAPVPGTTIPGAPAVATCDAAVPDRACKPGVALRVCKPGDADRVGEWRYAIAAPAFSRTENVTADELKAAWAKSSFTATADAIAALTTQLGDGHAVPLADTARPDVTDTLWAIVPADELMPNWKVVTVDGVHPLDHKPGPLAVPLCGSAASSATKIAVRNIDPEKLTVLVMTGTTALTRFTSKLMEEKGVLYPLPGVEPWLAAADFVHISNEVSFLPKCNTGDGKPTMQFCSKESYIELLEKSHANIIELTGSHLHDFGHDWIKNTIAMYEKRGWIWFGGGRDQVEATTPRLLEHKGNKLAFLGCNAPMTEWKVLRRGPGVAACDLPRMQWQIADLRKRGYVPIVSVQHDEVYKHDPPQGLVRDLRALADAGPAFVMGSQAHCPHPWEVHRGAYVHYGPGNFYFDQFWHPVRDAAQDKLYIHANKLLTVGHLYTRIEERGRPRVLDAKERTELLTDLAGAQTRLPKGAEPWGAPLDIPMTRDRPDSIVINGQLHAITVKTPAKIEPDKKYPLVVDVGLPVDDDNAFVVKPSKSAASAKEFNAVIVEMMQARYPIDHASVTFSKPAAPTKPTKPAKKK